MISPDVWSFKPPNTLITHKYDKLTEKAEQQISKKIHHHFFNKMVSLFCEEIWQN